MLYISINKLYFTLTANDFTLISGACPMNIKANARCFERLQK